MKIKILQLICTLLISTGCLDPKQAMDLVDAMSDGKPSAGSIDRIIKSEDYLKREHGLNFVRVPPEGNLKSYNIRLPRDANMREVLYNLETYQIDLDKFLKFTDGNFNRKDEYQKKLAATNDFLENHYRKDEYFTSPNSSHD